MARLHPNLYVQNTIQQWDMNRLSCIGRKAVVPGESIGSCEVTVNFRSNILSRLILSNLEVVIEAFYVPYRLVWDQFVDFVVDDSIAPLTANVGAFPTVFERGTTTRSPLGRRAFKLIYNQFYGDESFGTDAWYADITDDTDTSQTKRLIVTDQMLRRGKEEVDVDEDTFDATVSGAIASIPLQQFYEAMALSRAKTRRSVGGDKYVDALRSMGVDPDWRVQQAPERLARYVKYLQPTVTRATNVTDQGVPAGSHFEGKCKLRFGGKRFAEHGIVLITIAPRFTQWFLSAAGAPAGSSDPADAYFLTTREGFYAPEAARGIDVFPVARRYGGATGEIALPRYSYLRDGENLYGNVPAGANFTGMATQVGTHDDFVYSDNVVLGFSGPIGDDYAAATRSVIRGVTPIPKDIY